MDISVTKFEDMNLYSNKNLEKLLSSIIAESSNAVLVSMYEDAAILLDHEEGQFYMCEYEFDADNARVSFKNFDPINLKREQTSFKDTVYNFFESEETEVSSLLEDYKVSVMSQDKFITDLINESMSVKDFSETINYSELSELNEHVLDKEEFFVDYKSRLQSHPLTEAKYFNWKDPVIVSLVETEEHKLLNSSAKEKAASLWKNEEFKAGFVDAASTFKEDVEQGVDMFADLFSNYPQVFYLDNADRKTLFGKMLISSSLREDRNDILKGIGLMFEREEAIKVLQEEYMTEGAFEDAESMDFTDDKGETKPTRKEKDEMFNGGKRDKDEGEDDKEEKEDKAKELTPEQLEKLSDELKKVSAKVKDEKLKEKIEDIAEKLCECKEEGTRPQIVKEAVELLSM